MTSSHCLHWSFDRFVFSQVELKIPGNSIENDQNRLKLTLAIIFLRKSVIEGFREARYDRVRLKDLIEFSRFSKVYRYRALTASRQ
jgi:hypothetical protein